MSRFQSLLERAGTNAPAPDIDLERVLRRRDRKRRNQRIAAGVVGIAVFVAAVMIVTSVGSLDRTVAPATGGGPQPTGPPHPVGVGLLNFPPRGATPSTPVQGELVVGFVFGHTSGDPGRFDLHVYADGRVIWERLGIVGVNGAPTGLIEQRLTPEGIDLVLDEVLSTGFFHRDRDRDLIGPLGGLHSGWIEVRTDRLERLTWGDLGTWEGRQAIEATASRADVRALEQLDARFEDLASWLPESAWEDQEYRAYVPSWYSVCYSGEGGDLERQVLLNRLPAPVGDFLRDRDITESGFEGPLGPVSFWCSTMTTDEARAFAGVIEDAGAARNDPVLPSFRFESPDGPAIGISLEPELPHATGGSS